MIVCDPKVWLEATLLKQSGSGFAWEAGNLLEIMCNIFRVKISEYIYVIRQLISNPICSVE